MNLITESQIHNNLILDFQEYKKLYNNLIDEANKIIGKPYDNMTYLLLKNIQLELNYLNKKYNINYCIEELDSLLKKFEHMKRVNEKYGRNLDYINDIYIKREIKKIEKWIV